MLRRTQNALFGGFGDLGAQSHLLPAHIRHDLAAKTPRMAVFVAAAAQSTSVPFSVFLLAAAFQL